MSIIVSDLLQEIGRRFFRAAERNNASKSRDNSNVYETSRGRRKDVLWSLRSASDLF